MNFEIIVRTGRLEIPGDVRDGRLTFIAVLAVGRRRWFVERWDTLRTQPDRGWQWRGPVMSLHAGRAR